MNITQTTTKYQTYPKYKPSGIDWLGDLPDGWEIWEYGHLFLSSMGETILREDLVDDGKIPVYSATEENINFGYVDSASVILNKGDLVIPARGNSIGNVKLVDKLSTTTQTTIYSKLIKKNKVDIRYVLYLLKGLKDIYFFFDRTAIPQITVNQVQNNDLCIPPIEDQKSIADFLDRETAKIDEVVGKKQKLMELLKEKRQALIAHAVTCGLDENGKLRKKQKCLPASGWKPSGIDWLGDIPEGWDVKKLKYVAKSNVSSLAEDTAPDYLFKYLDIGNVGTGYILEEPIEMYFENAPSRSRRIVKKNDTIISTVRTYLKAIYHFGNNPMDLIVSTGFAVIEVGTKINPKFFYYLSLSENFIDSIVSNSYGVSYPAINESFLMTLPIWYPKIDKQKGIAAFLNRETSKINGIIKKVEIQIEKLQEYRQAIITSAVTGKIKI